MSWSQLDQACTTYYKSVSHTSHLTSHLLPGIIPSASRPLISSSSERCVHATREMFYIIYSRQIKDEYVAMTKKGQANFSLCVNFALEYILQAMRRRMQGVYLRLHLESCIDVFILHFSKTLSRIA